MSATYKNAMTGGSADPNLLVFMSKYLLNIFSHIFVTFSSITVEFRLGNLANCKNKTALGDSRMKFGEIFLLFKN